MRQSWEGTDAIWRPSIAIRDPEGIRGLQGKEALPGVR